MPKIESDIATIKESLRYIQRDVGEIKHTLDIADNRITANEAKIVGIQTKLGILAIFQVAFSTIASGISAFLGGTK